MQKLIKDNVLLDVINKKQSSLHTLQFRMVFVHLIYFAELSITV